MLEKVEVTTEQGELLPLVLADVSDGIIVKEITGLGPVKATLVSTSFAGLDGEQYQTARREPRDLRFKFGLEAMYGGGTVRAIRQRLYKFFMTKRNVKMKFFMTDGLVVEIWGRVESNDPPMFTREPEMDVVLRCFLPDFIDPTVVHLTGNTTSLTTETLVQYEGDVDTGLIFKLNVDRTINEFTIYHRPPDGSLLSLDFASPLLSGDVLTISTTPGDKYASLLRGGATSSLLRGVSPYANWPMFQPGDNHIRVYATGASIPYTIDYFNHYGGL